MIDPTLRPGGSPLERSASRQALGLFDAEPVPDLDRLAAAVTRLLGAPVSLVSLVDGAQQWLPGVAGLAGPAAAARQAPASHSFCWLVVLREAPLAVDDARAHPLVAGSPATDALGVRAYLGVPLRSPSGTPIGALCAIDHRPRRWTADERATLEALAAAAEGVLRGREYSTRLQLSAEATQEVLYSQDYATSHVERYGAVRALYGRTAEQLPATPGGWLACVHPDDRPRVAASWDEALAARAGHWACEYRMIHPDGRVVVVEDRARIVVDGRGEPWRVVGAVRDVTRARAAEAALQESEARWRQLFEIANAGICAVDPAGRVTYANPRLAAMLGWSAAELVGTDLYARFPAEDAPAARARLAARVDAPGDPRDDAREVVLCRRDGTRVWVHEAASAIHDRDGGVAGALFLLTDVTERRLAEAARARSEAALRASDARLRLALEVAGLQVWERDLETGRLCYDDAAGSVPPSRRFADFAEFLAAVHPDERAGVAQADADAIARGGDVRVEYRVLGPSAAVGWQSTVGRVVRGADGRPAHMLGATMDVTERVLLEAQLRQAQKMEALGQLAGGIAHDFNNLLTVICSNLEFLRDDVRTLTGAAAGVGAGASCAQDLDEIAQAASRARLLVRQLLTFSRQQPVHAGVVALDEVVHQAERLLRRVIGEEIALSTAIAGAPLYAAVDPVQVEQLLLNLALNARDAMLTPRHGHAGTGGTLEIAVDGVTLAAAEAAAWGVSAGAWVRLQVRDTGHGMDAEAQAHAFEPFYTTKAVGGGTGLGLATVFGIVRRAGGALRVDSAPGRGCTVTALLPAADGADAAVVGTGGAPAAADPSGLQDDGEPPAQTLLLVEDERAVRTATRRLLERRGWHVLEARHGADALALWRAHRGRIAAVITDVRMPEMGGPELAARLHAEAPGLPVVFVSGYAAEGAPLADRPHLAFLEKPFTGEALVAALEAVRRPARAGGP